MKYGSLALDSKGAFMHDRGPLIENFLKDENKRVFIAYSEPASNNDGNL